jgi:hypothetical protein
MKRTVKRLILKRETVRTLQDAELRAVAGGGPGFSPEEQRVYAERQMIISQAGDCSSTVVDQVMPLP